MGIDISLSRIPTARTKRSNAECLRLKISCVIALFIAVSRELEVSGRITSNSKCTLKFLDFFSCNDLEIESVVNAGAFGYCYKSKLNNINVIVKIFKNRRNFIDISDESELPINALIANIHHPNLVKYLGYGYNTSNGFKHFYLVMDYIPGQNLHQTLHLSEVELSETYKINLIIDVCKGLKYLHGHNICHLDIKPKNIMVDSRSKSCKLIDYECSPVYKETTKQKLDREPKNVICKTIPYTAPELFKSNSFSLKSDIYSLGITIWETMHRQIPYESISDKDSIIFQVVAMKLRPSHLHDTENSEIINKKIIDLIDSCLNEKVDHRPSAPLLLLQLKTLLGF